MSEGPLFGERTMKLVAAAVLLLAPYASAAAVDHEARAASPPAAAAVAGQETVAESRPAVSDDRAFGFRLGEERRYALEPPGALAAGESEEWIIRLESIEGDASGRRVNFYLEHEATHYNRTANVFSRGELQAFRAVHRVTVNESGFPLRVDYEADLEDVTSPYSRERVELLFQGGEFLVSNPFSMAYREFAIPIAPSQLVDLSIPEGVFLAGSENPGLFGLILAGVRMEEVGDLEYLALAPSVLASRRSRSRGLWGRVGDYPAGPPRRRAASRRHLRFEELTTVDIGGTKIPALRLRRTTGVRPDIYVQRDGTVLRVDTSTALRHTAWIRLLRPFEY